jgi:hypothetical protein
MRTRIILLERLVLMMCEMRYNMRPQNLIDVTGSCYSISSPRAKILEDNWTKFHVESDATPYHDAWTAPSIPFLSAVVIIVLLAFSTILFCHLRLRCSNGFRQRR